MHTRRRQHLLVCVVPQHLDDAHVHSVVLLARNAKLNAVIRCCVRHNRVPCGPTLQRFGARVQAIGIFFLEPRWSTQFAEWLAVRPASGLLCSKVNFFAGLFGTLGIYVCVAWQIRMV